MAHSSMKEPVKKENDEAEPIPDELTALMIDIAQTLEKGKLTLITI